MTDQPAPPSPTQAEQALPLLARAAADSGAQAYAVGGYVRDQLIGAATADVDVLLTRCLREVAERVALALRVAVVTMREEKAGIRLVFADRSHIDLSLPRGENERCVTADDAASQPAAAADADLVRRDLRLRDFTVNAMAAPLPTIDAPDWRGSLIDPTGGLADLEHRILRATGPGVWQSDPLRLLRAVRLAAQLGLTIEPATAAALRAHARLLPSVAPERIRDELFALLARADAESWVERAAGFDLLFQVIPELKPLQHLGQEGYHHLDVWHHSLAVVANLEEMSRATPGTSPAHQGQLSALLAEPLGGDRSRLALLKLAGLLHDVGKPGTFEREPDGALHFYGHDEVGAKTAREIGRRLRLARREQQHLETVVASHMHPAFLAQQAEISRHAAHRFFRRTRDYAPDVLLLAWADRLGARGPAVQAGQIERVEAGLRWLLEEWLDRGPLSHPKPPIGARAIMRRYALEPGPAVGRIVERLTRRHARRPFVDADEAWAYLDGLQRRLATRARRADNEPPARP